MHGLKIRDAIPDDASAMSGLLISSMQRHILTDCSKEGAVILLSSVTPCAILDTFSPENLLLVAEIEKQIVGVITIKKGFHLYHLFVGDEHQRKGIARRLWQTAMKKCLQRKKPEFFTVNSALNAVDAYAKLGFRVTDEVQSRAGVRYIPMEMQVIC